MESEGSDQRQDILAPLHLGPHTAAGTSAGSPASCQSHHTTRDQQADDFVWLVFTTVCVWVVKAAGNSPDYPQTPLLLILGPGNSVPHTRLLCPAPAVLYTSEPLWEKWVGLVCVVQIIATHSVQWMYGAGIV